MYISSFFTALVGIASLASAAPQSLDERSAVRVAGPAERKIQRRQFLDPFTGAVQPLILGPPIQQTTITVIQNNNLDVIDELTQLAERQFGALIQSQLALVAQLQTIKNNIRVNHFRSRFTQVNTIIVTVTNVLDRRDGGAGTNRYLINQLLADNGVSDRNIVIMVSDTDTMTIQPTATGSLASRSTGLPSFDLSTFDPLAPFGTLNQSVILPSGTEAPTLDLVFPDPASIIFANQAAFVESPVTFFQSCAVFAANGNSFVNRAGTFFTSFQQIAAAQLAGLRAQWLLRFLGTATATATSTTRSTTTSTSETATTTAK